MTHIRSRGSLVFLAICLLAAPVFAGYEFPLPSAEIRNAFFLGQRDDSATAAFLTPYAHKFTQPQAADYNITEVDVVTPYVQVIQRGARNLSGDSEVQTETDLRAHPLRFIVKAVVAYSFALMAQVKPVHAAAQSTEPELSIEAEQAHPITNLGMTETGFGWKGCPCGVILTAEFDAAQITSAPMHIIVHTPDGQSVTASFDMSKLK